jgi:hypothetical protein
VFRAPDGRIAAALFVCGLLACGDTAGPSRLDGTFPLTHIGAEPLPTWGNSSPSSGGPLWVISGELTLRPDGTFALGGESTLAPDEGPPQPWGLTGQYSIGSGGPLTLTLDGVVIIGRETLEGEISSSAITVTDLFGNGPAQFAR